MLPFVYLYDIIIIIYNGQNNNTKVELNYTVKKKIVMIKRTRRKEDNE